MWVSDKRVFLRGAGGALITGQQEYQEHKVSPLKPLAHVENIRQPGHFARAHGLEARATAG